MKSKRYFIFGLAFLMLLLALVLYRLSFREMNEYIRRVNHSEKVIVAFEQLSSNIKTALMLSSDPGRNHKTALMELYKRDIENIPSRIHDVKILLADNPRQLKRLDILASMYTGEIQPLVKISQLGTQPPDALTNHFQNIIKIHRLIDRGVEDEKQLLISQNARFEVSARRTDAMTFVFVTIALLLVIATTLLYGFQVKERKNLERFLESVLNTSESAIITYQAIRKNKQITDFKVIFANESVKKQIGLDPGEIIGKTMLSISQFARESGTMERCIRVTETGNIDQFETSFGIDNNTRWYNATMAKLNDGFTVTTFDITRLKEYQQELHKKLELLEYTNNELEQFAYVASHDLQEPLRKIKTFASLIDGRLSDPSATFVKDYLSKIIHSANRMSNLISDLLNLSDISARRDSVTMTDLNVIIRNVLIDFELIIADKQALITVETLPGIEAIPSQMNQLFYNLINNALKFSSLQVQPQISITTSPLSIQQVIEHQLDKDYAFQEITVSDNGIGFNAQFAEKVFIIFQRLHSRQQYSGSGIGLALCKKIVLNHHGAIYAEAKENQGASFHVVLPLMQPRGIQAQSTATRETV